PAALPQVFHDDAAGTGFEHLGNAQRGGFAQQLQAVCLGLEETGRRIVTMLADGRSAIGKYAALDVRSTVHDDRCVVRVQGGRWPPVRSRRAGWRGDSRPAQASVFSSASTPARPAPAQPDAPYPLQERSREVSREARAPARLRPDAAAGWAETPRTCPATAGTRRPGRQIRR